MNKAQILKTVNKIKQSTIKHSPEILTGMGIAGMLTSTVLAVKATPKALYLIDEVKAETNVDKLSKKELMSTTWKCYIPTAVTAVMSTACLIGASSVNIKRNAALATAYGLSETMLKEYREKVIETIGQEKEEMVRDAVLKDRINKNQPCDNEIFITEKGNTLCYDSLSGRYFKSDIDALKKIQNNINAMLLNEGYISLNDLYYEIGLSATKLGSELGWNVDNGLVEFRFSSQLTENDEPCIVLDYISSPVYEYS